MKLIQIITLPSLSTSFSLNIQFFPHTKASNISGVSELLESPRILPPRLKADSEGTVLRGITRKSRAMVDKTENFSACAFHQAKMSKFSISPTQSSSKYMSISDFGSCVFLRLHLKFANSCPSYHFVSIGEPTVLLASLIYAIEYAPSLAHCSYSTKYFFIQTRPALTYV